MKDWNWKVIISFGLWVALVVTMALCMSCSVERRTFESLAPGPWERKTIYDNGVGADGVDLTTLDLETGPALAVASAWEQSGFVSVSVFLDAGPDRNPNIFTFLLLNDHGHFGLEDVRWGDVDRDGLVDLVSSCECGKVSVMFQPQDIGLRLNPAAWETMELPASAQYRWMQATVITRGSVNHVVAGSKTHQGIPATIAEWVLSGNPRVASSWTYTPIKAAGWTMTLKAQDFNGDGNTDLFITDRAKVSAAPQWALYGSRTLQQTSGPWTHRTIATAPQVKGDQMMGWISDSGTEVWDGYSTATTYPNVIMHHTAPSWTGPWTFSTIPDVPNVGHYQAAIPGDLDNDGDQDLVITYFGATGALSGVVALILENGLYERFEISGPDGDKFDNAALWDVDSDGFLDVITSEQNRTSPTVPSPLGVVVYYNPWAL